MNSLLAPPDILRDTPVDEYLEGFEENSSSMISNLCTVVKSYSPGSNITLPVTINYSEYDNSYVCSPYTALMRYSLEELEKLNQRTIKWLLFKLIPRFDRWLKSNHINRIVHINNWMLSTNLYPEHTDKIEFSSLITEITQNYPQHAIILRSLNEFSNSQLILKLVNAGFLLVPSRQVYIYNKNLKDFTPSHNYKLDDKLLKKTNYQYVNQNDIQPSDYARIVELYNQLYIQKYSLHNPQFTEKFIASIIKHPHFYLEGFRNKHGILDAVGGRFMLGKVITLPIVGYDTSISKKLGLYRLVLMSTLLFAEKNGYTFNASSGASHFKRLRGAVAYIEYSAVYVKHLPKSVQRLWKFLDFILKYVFVPILKKYHL